MKKAMISQPMAGKTEKEIEETREKAIQSLKECGYDIVDSYFKDDWNTKEDLSNSSIVNIPVYFLAKSLRKMCECNAVYFCKGWENARGCRIERAVAEAYHLRIIEEN